MTYLFEGNFGFFPKKNVKLDEENIFIGKNDFKIDEITCVYFRPFNFSKNEWGTVYFSLDGKDIKTEELFPKNIFKFTKKQTDTVLELLNMINIPVVQKENDLNAMPLGKTKKNHVIIKCPQCDSTNVNFMQNNKKNFSIGKATAGAALTGGIGTLAGFAGKKGNNQWHCKSCGNVFETKIN